MLAGRTCPAWSASATLLASRPCAAAGVALAARWDGQGQGERGERWLLHGRLRAAVAALPGASASASRRRRLLLLQLRRGHARHMPRLRWRHRLSTCGIIYPCIQQAEAYVG